MLREAPHLALESKIKGVADRRESQAHQGGVEARGHETHESFGIGGGHSPRRASLRVRDPRVRRSSRFGERLRRSLRSAFAVEGEHSVLGSEKCRASRADARRALVLRTEPPSAFRPFGFRSLTQSPQFAESGYAALVLRLTRMTPPGSVLSTSNPSRARIRSDNLAYPYVRWSKSG